MTSEGPIIQVAIRIMSSMAAHDSVNSSIALSILHVQVNSLLRNGIVPTKVIERAQNGRTFGRRCARAGVRWRIPRFLA